MTKKQKIPTIKNLTRYEVTIEREVRYRAVVEVEAENEDVAKDMAKNLADAPRSGYWLEDACLSQTSKAKALP